MDKVINSLEQVLEKIECAINSIQDSDFDKLYRKSMAQYLRNSSVNLHSLKVGLKEEIEFIKKTNGGE